VTFSYKEVTAAKPGEGYWALSMADEILNANITPISDLTINLKQGWNMIGGVNGNVDFSDPQDNPESSVIPPIYTYNPSSFGYEEKTAIEPGKGYWILALNECILTLNSTSAAPAKKNTTQSPQTAKMDWVVPIHFITNKGIKDMALGIQMNASDGFDPYIDTAMPPSLGMDTKQPEASFQIEDRLVNRLSRDIKRDENNVVWKMNVESQQDDVELAWDSSSVPSEKDLYFQCEGSEINMRYQKNVKILSGKHTVVFTLKNRIPTKPELLQNYPNPFNPDTWIPYQLSEAGKVVISIYDTSGRRVRRLDLGHKEAGIYVSREKSAHWDGRNEAGERVSSGVYFYHIESGKFSKMMKLVIIR
jgi:hypothetical protein